MSANIKPSSETGRSKAIKMPKVNAVVTAKTKVANKPKKINAKKSFLDRIFLSSSTYKYYQSTNELFLKSIERCNTIYDYSDGTKDAKAKSERLKTLQELSQSLQSPKIIANFVLPHLNLLFEMIENNIFRPVPTDKKSTENLENWDTGIESGLRIVIDPAWPYLKGVYELFFELVTCETINVDNLKVYVTPSFVQRYLQLFNSEEVCERDNLKTILHRLYAKLIPRRKMIRKAITDCLLTMIHESQEYNGAGELLSILVAIINGFGVPLSKENLSLFKEVLIPLHKVPTSHLFFEELQRCCMVFLSKDHALAILLIEGLLRYWPVGNSKKEIFFIGEIGDAIEVCELSKLEPLISKLFKRLFCCISGPQLQVSDRAMQFFETEYFLNIFYLFKEIAFPMIVPVVVKLAETHWHKTMLDSFNLLSTILKDIDPGAFDQALMGPRATTGSLHAMHQLAKRAVIETQWEELTKRAKKMDPNFAAPVVPYVDSHVVGLNNLNGIKLCSDNLIMLY
jgi:serine/threonine-protein phosphatase 2A regulatory subunit B'